MDASLSAFLPVRDGRGAVDLSRERLARPPSIFIRMRPVFRRFGWLLLQPRGTVADLFFNVVDGTYFRV